MSSTFRWFMAGTVIVGCVIAACSSSDDGKPTGPVMTEVARKQVGSAGGSVSGGGATIEIPEGAVEDGTTIVINQLTASAANLPKSSVLAGAVYSLLPDDVEFKKPVTVRLAIDPAKKPADGKGAIVIFRAPANTNDWTVKGATGVQGNEVVAKTTHFSWWAPAVAGDTSCLRNRCQLDAGTARHLPEFPGMDCVVPNSGGAAVHCKGTGPNASTPYECGCTGTDAVIATYDHPPSDSEISALATQCGAVCPPTVQIPCSISAVCGDYEALPGDAPAIANSTPGWGCKTTTAPFPLKCSHAPGAGIATCRCDNGTIIPLPTISPPNEDEMLKYWSDVCAGNCNPVLGDSGGGGIGGGDGGDAGFQDPCIPQLQYIPGHAQCDVSASCYGDLYSVDCLGKTADPNGPLKCDCRMNAGIVKSFDIASCDGVTGQSLADQCGIFPKPDDAGSGNLPDTGPPPPPPCGYGTPVGDPNGHPNCMGVMFDEPNPQTCNVTATCGADGYSAECARAAQPPSDGAPYDYTCTCKKGGAVVKTVSAQQCTGGPGGIGDLCGWPADTAPSTCTVPGSGGCLTHDEHVVCSPVDAGGGGLSECQCFKDGAVVATVSGACNAAGDPTVGAWTRCGFPNPGQK